MHRKSKDIDEALPGVLRKGKKAFISGIEGYIGKILRGTGRKTILGNKGDKESNFQFLGNRGLREQNIYFKEKREQQTCLLLRFLCIFYIFLSSKYALRITIAKLRNRVNPDFLSIFIYFGSF